MANTVGVVTQDDRREYSMVCGHGVTNSELNLFWTPIPRAGQIIHCMASAQVANDAEVLITFTLGGVVMVDEAGADAVWALETTPAGGTLKFDFHSTHPKNFANEAENLDLAAAGGVLIITGDANGSVGRFNFLITVRP